MAITNVGRIKGSMIYTGASTTSAAIKIELQNALGGDIYISTAATNLFFQYNEATSTWDQKASLKGLTGSQGPIGPNGPSGPQGDPGPKGDKGDPGLTGIAGIAAGFGTLGATVDTGVGTPTVTATSDGPNTAKNFRFEFKNLKGATGAQGIPGPAGMKGDTGEQGAQGLKGDKGADGKTPIVTASLNAKGELILDIS